MPWGKYRGAELGAVPADYLWWMLRNAQIASEELRLEACIMLGIDPRTAPRPRPGSADGFQKKPAAGGNGGNGGGEWQEKGWTPGADPKPCEQPKPKPGLGPDAAARAAAELQQAVAAATAAALEVERANLEAKVKVWYRQLALRYHADRGAGDSASFQVVNEANSSLRKILGIPGK